MVVAMYLFACVILVHFVAPTALISMLLPFMNALDEDSKVQPSHLLFPGVVTAHAAQSSLPLGNALAGFVTANAILEANGAEPTLGPFSTIIVALPAMIVVYLYYVFIGWKLYPARGLDASAIKEYKDKETTIDKKTETLIYVVFVATMLGIVLNSIVDNFPIDMYIMPVLACVILGLTKTMNGKEMRDSMNTNTMFMLIGVLPLATAMQKSNAAQIVADAIVKVLGGHPSYPVFLLAFMIVGGILTQFMSNTATNNVFRPLAIITAVSLGYNAAGVAVACGLMTTAAMLTPMGSPSLAIAYGAGGYTQKELLKANLPAWILHTIVVFIFTLIFYPVAG
jgi:di/tricarboxylate transporter